MLRTQTLSRPMRVNGFTMVELTIVVLVILIIFGLAIPRFAALTDASKQADCISKVRVVEMAVSQWEQKNKAEFPQGWISLTGLGRNNAQYDLTPYVKDVSVFDCPLANRGAGEFYYIRPRNDQQHSYGGWFPGVNCWYIGRPPHLTQDYPHTTHSADPY